MTTGKLLIRSACLIGLLFFISCNTEPLPLGEHEAIRTYVEFADGTNRGMYNPDIEKSGLPDEDFDATTAMVINWHRLPEDDASRDARVHYRMVHPQQSSWMLAEGESYEFWHREELVNRVIITDLQPNSVYEYKVKAEGMSFHFRTMPANLNQRPVTIVFTSDHQNPGWGENAHNNARMAALQKPDMFVVAGDFVNDEGVVSEQSAGRWEDYLNTLYGVNEGYFLYDLTIDDQQFSNTVIPHVSVVGNHETGEEHHIRWPADLYTSQPSYPQYVAANWLELLFHWPFKSEGFYSEYRPDHPNMNPEQVMEGFGQGGFGKLSFGDYLMLIGMDNSQNWEGEPDKGLRDWQGNLITDRWPWFETHHSTVRQDLWLKNLLEPEGGPSAGERYTHIIPVWHRGLFGTARQNMTFKNRNLLADWLPLLYRNGVKLIKEGHDHLYTRTVPLGISGELPVNSYLEKVVYEPLSPGWSAVFDEDYLDQYFSINTIMDSTSHEIVGWEYEGNYITPKEDGMIAIGHGGWAGGRREVGQRGGGNAGFWYVDPEKGGESFGGEESFHIHIVTLTSHEITTKAFHPNQLSNFEAGSTPVPISTFRRVLSADHWQVLDSQTGEWVRY